MNPKQNSVRRELHASVRSLWRRRLSRNRVFNIGLLLLLVPGVVMADTAFTYQGELSENGEPAAGSFDMEFSLWDALEDGNQLCCPVAVNNVQVFDGRFTAQLDFGADVFTDDGRWLEIIVGGFTLSPRQPITRSPYSIQTRGIFVDENQNVGIGTNTPNAKLDVNGLAAFENTVFSEQATFGGGARLQGGGLIVDGPSSGGPTDHSVSIYAITDGDSLRSINDGNGKAGRFQGDVLMTGGLEVDGNGSDPVIHAEVNGTGPGLRVGKGPDTLDVDNNSINTRGDSPISDPLYLNNDVSQPVLIGIGGGNLGVGGGTAGLPVVKLHVDGGTPAQWNDPTSGYVLVGSPVGPNIVVDYAEIQARDNGHVAPLWLNPFGGDTLFGGTLDIPYTVVVGEEYSDLAACPSSMSVIGGGCRIEGDAEIRASYPSGNAWHCEAGDISGVITLLETYAICAGIK